MSNVTNKSTTLNVSDIPRFNGSNFQGWSEKMIGIMMMAKVYSVVSGETVKPAEDTRPVAPTEPADISTAADAAGVARLNAMWTQYQVRMANYNHLLTEFNRKVSSWNDANSQAMGIFSRALQNGIWDQIKTFNSKQSWDWLKEKYAKKSHLETMEHFRFMKDQRIDLSDPNPQLAAFMHHYQALPVDNTGDTPVPMISSAMAALILLSNLPLTANPGQVSVYQTLLENTFQEENVRSLVLTDVMTAIRDVWAARFGGFNPNQQPRRGQIYDKGKAPANKPSQPKQQTQVQRNTAIKGKGPNPQYSEQQSTDYGSSQRGKKPRFRRGGKGRGAHSHMAGAPDTFNSEFVLASLAIHIADTPALAAPTAHTVTSLWRCRSFDPAREVKGCVEEP